MILLLYFAEVEGMFTSLWYLMSWTKFLIPNEHTFYWKSNLMFFLFFQRNKKIVWLPKLHLYKNLYKNQGTSLNDFKTLFNDHPSRKPTRKFTVQKCLLVRQTKKKKSFLLFLLSGCGHNVPIPFPKEDPTCSDFWTNFHQACTWSLPKCHWICWSLLLPRGAYLLIQSRLLLPSSLAAAATSAIY